MTYEERTIMPSKICGIYKITNLINNKSYIGQSVDIKIRRKESSFTFSK